MSPIDPAIQLSRSDPIGKSFIKIIHVPPLTTQYK